jgi:hypothetical protein
MKGSIKRLIYIELLKNGINKRIKAEKTFYDNITCEFGWNVILSDNTSYRYITGKGIFKYV